MLFFALSSDKPIKVMRPLIFPALSKHLAKIFLVLH